jgi:hypothetical protein
MSPLAILPTADVRTRLPVSAESVSEKHDFSDRRVPRIGVDTIPTAKLGAQAASETSPVAVLDKELARLATHIAAMVAVGSTASDTAIGSVDNDHGFGSSAKM